MNTPHPRSAAAVAADCYAEGYENGPAGIRLVSGWYPAGIRLVSGWYPDGTADAEHGDPITAYLVDCEDAEYVTGYLNGYHAAADSLAAFIDEVA